MARQHSSWPGSVKHHSRTLSTRFKHRRRGAGGKRRRRKREEEGFCLFIIQASVFMHLLSTFISERHAAKTFSTPPAFALSLRTVFRANQMQMSLNSLTPRASAKRVHISRCNPIPLSNGGWWCKLCVYVGGGVTGVKTRI